MNKIDIESSYKLVIFSLSYGISFYYLKTLSKQNSWLVVIIASLIGFLFIKMCLKIKNHCSNKSIYEINKLVLGNKLGTIINIIYSITFILLSTIIFWYLFIFLKTNFLEKTPILIISIVSFLPILYAINKNNLIIIKSNTIFSFIVSILTIIAIIFLIFQVDISNLKPFQEIKKTSMFYAIFSFFTTSFLPTYALTGLNNLYFKNIYKSFTKILLLILTIVLLTYLVLGVSIVEIIDFPEFFVLRKIGLLANGTRIDSLIIIGWFLSVYSINITLLFFVRNFLKFEFKSYKNNFNYILILIILFLSIFIFKNVTQGKIFILHVLPFILFFNIFIPNFIIFLKIKKKPILVSHNNYKNN